MHYVFTRDNELICFLGYLLSSGELNKIDKVQSTFWREWKLKLEEKKCVADRSRLLEQIIPGVETARFLSGDIKYIESVVFSLVESVKLEKKPILNNVLKLVETYGLNHTEVCGITCTMNLQMKRIFESLPDK